VQFARLLLASQVASATLSDVLFCAAITDQMRKFTFVVPFEKLGSHAFERHRRDGSIADSRNLAKIRHIAL
jgi:hypothetical protein